MIGALAILRFNGANNISFNLSLFEPLVMILTAWHLIRNGLSRSIAPIMIAVVAAIALGLHFYWVRHVSGMDPSMFLFKGYARNIVILFDLAALYILLSQNGAGWLQPRASLKWPFLIIAAVYLTIFVILANTHEIFVTRTVFSSNLLLLYLLYRTLVGSLKQVENFVVLATIAIASFYMLSKIGVLISCGLMIVSIFESRLIKQRSIRIIGAAVAVALGVFAMTVILPMLEINGRTLDSVYRSMSVRLNLWEAGLYGIRETFPVGIGAGVFKPFLETAAPGLYTENHQYIHSLPLSYVTELGLLGCIILAGLMAAYYFAARGYASRGLLASFLVVTLPLMILHDIQAVRLFMMLIMVGVAINRQPNSR